MRRCERPPCDLWFVDGGKAQTMADLHNAVRSATPGAPIVQDDCGFIRSATFAWAAPVSKAWQHMTSVNDGAGPTIVNNSVRKTDAGPGGQRAWCIGNVAPHAGAPPCSAA